MTLAGRTRRIGEKIPIPDLTLLRLLPNIPISDMGIRLFDVGRGVQASFRTVLFALRVVLLDAK